MRKYVIFILLIISSLMFAQSNAAAIKVGGFAPSAIDGMGFIIGYEGGKHIDENLDVCWSFDWFKKEYEDDSAAKKISEEFGGFVSADEKKKLAETTVYDFPIMFSVTAKFPIARKVKIFLNGGMGAELLYINYYQVSGTVSGEAEEATDWATSWNWRIGTGALYQLGQKSEFFGEFTWHSSKPKYEWDGKNALGQEATYERSYDMSGIMLRAGVRYYF